VAVCPPGIALLRWRKPSGWAEEIGTYPRIHPAGLHPSAARWRIAYNPEEIPGLLQSGLEASPVSQILIDAR